jgi:hypothetical protein
MYEWRRNAYVCGMAKAAHKTARFQIRMRPDVKEAAERAAEEVNRSLASFIETLLIEKLKKTGHLK